MVMDEAGLLQALEVDPADRSVAGALEALYESTGRWQDLVELLVSRLEYVDLSFERVDVLERAAGIYEGRLQSADNALLVLLMAFAEVPDDARFGPRLALLAEQSSRWGDLLDTYERLVEPKLDAAETTLVDNAEAPEVDEASLRRRLAQWYGAQDRDGEAARHWKVIYAQDPWDGPARAALEIHFDQVGDWSALVELLDTRLAETADPGKRGKLIRRTVRLLQKLGDEVSAFARLAQLWAETNDDGVEQQLEAFCEQTGNWAALAEAHERRAAEIAEAEPRAAAYLRLANLYERRLGDEDRAISNYDRCLAAEPDNARALAAMRRLLEASERWEDLARVLGREAEVEEDPRARYRRYLELGDLYHDRLDRAVDAVYFWRKAMDDRPDDKPVLARLMEAYGEAGDWPSSVKILKRLVRAETDPGKQARFLYAIAQIQGDQLEDPVNAVRTYDKALDADPTMLKAFAAIDELITRSADHERQDRYYRKMLVRAREHGLGDDLIVKLANGLGEINRSRLRNYEAARQAYSIVLRLRPEQEGLRAIMVELDHLSGDYEAAARGAYELIRRDPTQPEGYHQLARYHHQLKRPDAAWCVCQALRALGASTPDEDRFYQKGRRRGPARAERALGGREWALITAEGKDPALDALFLELFEVIGPLMAQDLKSLGISAKRDGVDLRGPHPIARVAGYAAQVLGGAPPPAWRGAGVVGAWVANLEPPALLLGDDLAGERPVEHLAFALSRAMYLLGRQHLLACIDATPELGSARLIGTIGTLLKAMDPGSTYAADSTLLKRLKKLPQGSLAGAAPIAASLRGRAADFGVPEWLKAVQLSADAVGFVVSNHLKSAVQMIREDRRPVGPLSDNERIRALVLFSISEPYFELRSRLGLGIS